MICAVLVFALIAAWSESGITTSFRAGLRRSLSRKLVVENPVSREARVDGIYILGGSPKSLELKFRKAAAMFQQGMAERILILSSPGITEYSPLLGRNMTNDEWSILRLSALGVPAKNIEPVFVEEGFFGTLSEAEGIARVARQRGYRKILLVSSPFHGYRVKKSFDHFLGREKVDIIVQGSEEEGNLRQLLEEYMKAWVYDSFLLRRAENG